MILGGLPFFSFPCVPPVHVNPSLSLFSFFISTWSSERETKKVDENKRRKDINTQEGPQKRCSLASFALLSFFRVWWPKLPERAGPALLLLPRYGPYGRGKTLPSVERQSSATRNYRRRLYGTKMMRCYSICWMAVWNAGSSRIICPAHLYLNSGISFAARLNDEGRTEEEKSCAGWIFWSREKRNK